MKKIINSKSTAIIAALVISICLSAFKSHEVKTENVSVLKLPHKTYITPFTESNIGWFVISGQEYHAYGDGSGNVVDVWETDNAMNDVTQATNVSGTTSGGHLTCYFTIGSINYQYLHGTFYE